MEHRWGNRIAVDLPVRISGAGFTGTGILRNLSVSGGFIETSLPLPSLGMVCVQIPRGRNAGLPAAGTWGFVARQDQWGIGVEWCDLAPLAMSPAALSSHSVSRQRSAIAPQTGNDFLTIRAPDDGTYRGTPAPNIRAPQSASRFPP
ncbi:MAG TPA: PilZ domain-containing protein [Steroidobacteraceae bacterium]|nr:PilZ domain-containing protein [Steroidobacteraceae bacterium]